MEVSLADVATDLPARLLYSICLPSSVFPRPGLLGERSPRPFHASDAQPKHIQMYVNGDRLTHRSRNRRLRAPGRKIGVQCSPRRHSFCQSCIAMSARIASYTRTE